MSARFASLAALLSAALLILPQPGPLRAQGIETSPLPPAGSEGDGDLLIDRDPFDLNPAREDEPLGLQPGQPQEERQDPWGPIAEDRAEPSAPPASGSAQGGSGLSAEEERRRPDMPDNRDLTFVDAPKARLRGLDTVSNTVDDFIVEVGQTVAFKRLVVTLEACRYPEGDIEKDAYAFLRIRDQRDEAPRFSGWMIASSPALSALDHPRYDVWVLSCSID